MPDQLLRAGAATANLTPPLGCSLAGGMTDRIATDIHDELHVRALVLDNDATRLAFAVCDSCAIAGDIIARAKHLAGSHTGIPMTNILVSATHTHSAPPAAHLFQSPPDPAYREFLITRIADAVRLAVNRLAPARVAWGVGREERLLFNRRYHMKPGAIPPGPFGRATDRVLMNPKPGSADLGDPAGPIDPDVAVLAVETPDGRPISLLASYALHYVGGVPSTHVSADYFGAWAESMRRMAGAGFVPILANACSGNLNNVNFRNPQPPRQPYEQMRRVADMLAAECYRVWRSLDFENWVELSAVTEDIELGVRLPGAEEIRAARATLEQAPGDGQYKERAHIYARETLLLAGWPRSVSTVVQAIRIGGLGIATMPGEAFVEIGLEVKARSPFRPTMMVELANDYRGYIPTPEHHRLGGYETWRAKSSYLEGDASPKLVASALRQLGRLKG